MYILKGFAFLSLFTSSLLFAGYDDNEWGQPIEAIMKKYPEGRMDKNTKGNPPFFELKKVVASHHALVDFYFGNKNQLFQVTITFADRELTNYDLPSIKDQKVCPDIVEDLRVKLIKKYKIKPEKVNGEEYSPAKFKYIWNIKNSDVIELANHVGPFVCMPIMIYKEKSKFGNSLEGL